MQILSETAMHFADHLEERAFCIEDPLLFTSERAESVTE